MDNFSGIIDGSVQAEELWMARLVVWVHGHYNPPSIGICATTGLESNGQWSRRRPTNIYYRAPTTCMKAVH
jgi:hypothetical protein